MSDLAWRDLGGSGRPLVMVHGYTGSSDDFAQVVGPLTDLRRVVLVDQLGHGESPRRDSYSLRSLTDSIVAFLEDVIGEAVDLLGHSMGGRVVLPIAVERPALVASLVLMDTWADAPDRDARARHMLDLLDQADADAIVSMRNHVDPPSPESALILERWGSDWVDAHEAHNSQVDMLAVVHLGREVFGEGFSLLRDATGIACPTTVLLGELDLPFVGPSERLAAHIPNAQLIVIPGAYHSPQLTHPEEWIAALRSHLRESSEG